MGEGKRESSWAQTGKGKAPQDHPAQKRKSPTTKTRPKGNGKRPAHGHFDPIPLGNQTARTHARTKRNDFPLEHPPTSDWFRTSHFFRNCLLSVFKNTGAENAAYLSNKFLQNLATRSISTKTHEIGIW